MPKPKGADLPFKCKFCGKYYRGSKRLPENHKCPGLKKYKAQRQKAFRQEVKRYFEEKRAKAAAKHVQEPVKHYCEDCGNEIIPYEAGYVKCRNCFFKTRKCTECGKLIRPYREGYTKCQSCFLKSQKIRIRTPPRHIYRGRNLRLPSLGSMILYIVIAMTISTIFSPFILALSHPNMNAVLGNPRPLYLYDIDASCANYDNLITSALTYLSDSTGVKFVRLPSPMALISGGVSYTCEGILSNAGAAGEAESGGFGGSFIIISWNRVKIPYPNAAIVLHETLHTMSFGHSNNPSSIMYPYASEYMHLDSDTIAFIKSAYVNNPLAYINIIPTNLLYILIVFLFIFFGIAGSAIRRN